MADEFSIKMPTVEQHVSFTVAGEEKLEAVSRTLNRISRNNDFKAYWKAQEELIKDVTTACANYGRAADNVNATALVNSVNALKGLHGGDISSLFSNWDSVSDVFEQAASQVGRVVNELSPENFSEAFQAMETLRAYGLDIGTVLDNVLHGADAKPLQNTIAQLNGELGDTKTRLQEAESELNKLRSGDAVRELESDLAAANSKLEHLTWNAQTLFSSFLDIHSIDPSRITDERYGDDGWETYYPIKEWMAQIREGSLSASEAIALVKGNYSHLLDEAGANVDAHALSTILSKIEEISAAVSGLQGAINTLTSNPLQTVAQNLSENTALTEEQRVRMGELAQSGAGVESVMQVLAELIKTSGLAEQSSETMLSSLRGVLEVVRDLSGVDIGNLQALSNIFGNLSRMNGLKINKSAFDNLAKGIGSINSLGAATPTISMLSALDLSRFNELKVSKASMNNLATYLPEIAKVDAANLEKLSTVNLTNFNDVNVSKGAVANLANLVNVTSLLQTVVDALQINLPHSPLDEVADDAKSAEAPLSDANGRLEQINTSLGAIESRYNGILRMKGGLTSEEDKVALEDLKNKFIQIFDLRTKMAGSPSEQTQTNFDSYYAQEAAIRAVIEALEVSIQTRKKSAKEAEQAAAREKKAEEKKAEAANDTTAMQKQALVLQKKMASALKNFTSATNTDWYKTIAAGKSEIDQMLSGVRALDAERLKQLNASFSDATGNIHAAGMATKSLGSILAQNAKKFASWFSVQSIIMRLIRLLKQMISTVTELDTSMTELKKVTDETDGTYRKFLTEATAKAKELGATITDVVEATAEFARLGYSLDDATALAEAAIVYKNVGDGIEDISSASESVIATMQAFGVAAEEAMLIVDKFNEVGNNFAISSQGIGEALLRSASAMNAAGNSLDETIALVTAANTVVN